MDSELRKNIIQDLKNWNESVTGWNDKRVNTSYTNYIERSSTFMNFYGGPGPYVPIEMIIKDFKISKIKLSPTHHCDDIITLTFFDNKLTYSSHHVDREFITVHTMTDLYDIIKTKLMNSKNRGKLVDNFFENMPCFLSIQYVLDKMHDTKQPNEEIIIEI